MSSTFEFCQPHFLHRRVALPHSMLLLIALSQLVVAGHGRRLAPVGGGLVGAVIDDDGPLKHDGLVKGASDDSSDLEEAYKRVIAAFAEDNTEIHFAPSSTAKAEERLSTPRKADGKQYYEVPLYVKSAKPICQNPEVSAGVYHTFLKLTVRYDDIKALVVFAQIVDEEAANATLSQLSIDDLAYIREHMSNSFPTKSALHQYDKQMFAASTYRMFMLFFRSTHEVRRIMRGALSRGLIDGAFTRSLESCLKQKFFVNPFTCSSGFDLAHILPAATPSEGLDSSALQKDLKIKFFDFNEETETKKDRLLSAYNALYDSMDGDEDVVVTCQTEARISAHNLMLEDEKWNSKWVLLGHGKHSGMTGPSQYNAQILNVFVRKPTNVNVETHQWPLDWDSKKDWVGIRGWANQGRRGTALANTGGGADTLIEAASIGLADGTFLVSAKSRLHETSGDGKGGISTLLSYQSAPGKSRTRISLICSHLDSETQSGREAGAEIILREAADFAARQEKSKPWKNMISSNSNDVDAIFVTGDLNYRLWYSSEQPLNDNAKMAAMIYTKVGRKKLASYDQLRSPGRGEALSSLSALTSKFGMKCNQPFESYLPTYKRRNKDACVALGTASKMIECGSFDVAACAQKCSSPDGCGDCFSVQKTCEAFALNCATGKTTSKHEEERVVLVVDSGADLGIKTMIFQDPITSELQLWITHVEEGKHEALKKITAGKWMIAKIEETDVDYYRKKKSKPSAKTEKFKPSVKVSKLKQAADIQTKVVSVLENLSTKTEGWKVVITFVNPKSKWGLKEKQFLQMGWLDRLCWKVAPSSSATVSLTSDRALMDSKVSDHLPVLFVVSVKRNN